MQLNRFAKYTWGTLLANVGVILWGAFVRATGSGAGCGRHWPLCNGVVVPRAEQVETLVEFTHRLTSGAAFVLVAGLVIWAWRAYPRRHPIRTGAALAMLFMISEALVGAGLVLFGWVAENQSPERAIVVSIHLVNTFMLTGCLTLTGWWASGGGSPRFREQGVTAYLVGIGLLLVLILSMSGAITALGDTLFPSESLAEGVRADFDPAAHFLIRLRVWHPLIAIATGGYVLGMARWLVAARDSVYVKRLGLALTGLFVAQLAAGLINLRLLAPVWMQIVHLALACAVWIALVLLGAAALAGDARQVDGQPLAVEPAGGR